MMIRNVTIYGLFETFDYNICFGPEPLTFVHSPNGYGKSTLMRLLSSVLKGDAEETASVPFSRLDIGFDDDTTLILENGRDGLTIQMQKTELEQILDPSEVAEILNVVYISSERLTVRKKDGRLVPALESYASELADRIRLAADHSELLPVPKEGRKEYGDDELVFWCKNLKAKLDFLNEAGFEPEMPAGYRFPPSRYEVAEYREDYTELAFSLSEYVDRNYTLAESIVVYKDIVNGLLVNKSLFIEDAKMEVRMDSGISLPLGRLSAGEKQVMIMFYCLLFHASPGSLAIIDEPEISMHVSWQHRIGDILTDISRLRGVQMIVATQSPQVIHDRWDQARELRVESA
ncbi:MAG: ATP-binding protein [Candidatus Methanomethylophilaceae archaeon]|jgi:ABC-type transport system involved in cytochrome c biogenesis ATPase subunit|nr:ATP-binding protein [Candidatus Methanomethylophilaceae archaeon]NLF33873.1 ATP-binding protein [Thermoplasmatales archaeon]